MLEDIERERSFTTSTEWSHGEVPRHQPQQYMNQMLESGRELNYTVSHVMLGTDEVNAHLVIITYAIILVVSLVGNSLVCKISFSGRGCSGKSQRSRTTTDLLIGSLACSDLLITIFNIPINIARLLLPHWPFGRFLCYGFPFVQTACVYVSTFTMTAIAWHRWQTVTLRNQTFAYSKRRLILTIWIVSGVLALPVVAFNTLKKENVDGKPVIRCRVNYPITQGFNISLFLTVEIFITQYLAPLLVACVLYLRIARVVSQQGKMTAVINNHKKRRRQQEAKRRIIMLALVVAVFALCWLPLNLYYLTIDLGLGRNNMAVFMVVSEQIHYSCCESI